MIRAATYDIETIIEASTMARDGLNLLQDAGVSDHFKAKTQYTVWPGGSIDLRYVDEADLAALGPVDRSALTASTFLPNGPVSASADIVVRRGVRSHVNVYIDNAANAADRARIERQLVKHLLDNGKPIVQWTRLAPYAPYVLFAGILTAWIVLLATAQLLPATVVLGWLGMALAATVSYALSSQIRTRYSARTTGSRVRTESRQATAARRADSHRDIKVIAITAPISLAVGVLGAILVYALGIKS